ncbi:MAG: hypothetical protein Q9M27_00780 [Mariprofundaceae bacterium]|nr:hypothetical protein [Mariprofundaceae bacterium]
MLQWMVVLAGFALLPPSAVFASDIAEGEISVAEVETQEAAHEQAEALRHRAEEDRAISEIRAAALRDGEEARAAVEEMALDDAGDATHEDDESGVSRRAAGSGSVEADDGADDARDPESVGEFEPAE